jgi:hypothetical protein
MQTAERGTVTEVMATTGSSRQLLIRGENIEHFMRNAEKV